MAAIRLEHLTRRHGTVRALEDLSLGIPAGSYTVVVGPSGSGKTTLLRLLAGLDRPDGGTVWVDGRDVTRLRAGERDAAWVPQSGALLPHLDVARNLALGLELRGVAPAERAARVAALGADLGLAGLLGRLPESLSAGERQRVALGRALIREPRLLLLDEPLANLDPHLRERLRHDLRAGHDPTRRTVVHVTHDPAEALAIADRILVLREGRLEQAGSPAEVYGHPASAFVAGFFGSPPMNLIPGGIDATGGGFRTGDGTTWPWSAPAGTHPPPAPLILGIRPEALLTGPDLVRAEVRLGGEVVGREFAGHEVHLTVSAAGGRWRLRSPDTGSPDRLEFGFRWRDGRWFAGPDGRAWPGDG